MLKTGLLAGLVLLLAATTAQAVKKEDSFTFKHGTPTVDEFLQAAKRTLFRRDYEFTSIEPRRLTGVYKDKVNMEISFTEDRIVIRNIDPPKPKSGIDVADPHARKVERYIENLKRDMIYELADYTL